jgi:hypothetical protein
MKNFKIRLTAIVSVLITVISLDACDGDDSKSPTPNSAPIVNSEIDDITLDEGFGTFEVNFSVVFQDSDGDQLTYKVTSSATDVVSASAVGEVITITEAGVGTSMITLTASDGNGGSINDSFLIAVNAQANNLPIINAEIADLTLDEGFGSNDIDFSNTFTDSDNDVLTYLVSSSDQDVATGNINGTTLTLTEVGSGTATFQLTANDGNGGMVSDEFILVVVGAENPPTVINAIADISLDEGFASHDVDISNTFDDLDGDALTYTTSSSIESVATVSISSSTLTVTEVGIGTTTITVTADDGKSETVSDIFDITVSAVATCSVDNSINTDLNQCPNTSADAGLTPSYNETVNGDLRTIVTNNVPDHSFGAPTNLIAAVGYTWKMDATPVEASQKTNLLGMVRIDFQFGVGLNGVKIDPEANFPYENTNSGEQNYGWMLEATNNTSTTTLDCNQAHLQADGAYHYHGDFSGYAAEEGINGTAMVQVGWAADGFPIYYKYAYSDANNSSSSIDEMQSSHQLKTGERPGDGVSEPCGEYNGKYEQDYEYVSGLGDLDECNGRTGVTPEFPSGTYYYLITGTYPYIPRCFSGTPDNSFRVGG